MGKHFVSHIISIISTLYVQAGSSEKWRQQRASREGHDAIARVGDLRHRANVLCLGKAAHLLGRERNLYVTQPPPALPPQHLIALVT